MKGGKRSGAGRKPVHIDPAELEKLCLLQCTDQDIAAFFGVDVRTIERRKKSINLPHPAIQFLWYQQAARRVLRARRKGIDAAMRLPFRQAPAKIGFQTRGGLIALLRIFREELHGDGG